MSTLSDCTLTLFQGQKKNRKIPCPWRNFNRPLTEYFFLRAKRPKHTEDHPTIHLHLSPAWGEPYLYSPVWLTACTSTSLSWPLPTTFKHIIIFYFNTWTAHVFFYFVLWPTCAQLIHKLSHSYMFRHYRVILRELVINTLPSYTSISKATCVTWQGIDYEVPEEDTLVSKHVRVW